MHLYRRGDVGPAIAEMRAKLAALGLLPVDGSEAFDDDCDRAIRGFQQARGLRVDGLVGPETYRTLDEARWQLGDRVLSFSVTHPFVGDDVAELQHRLLDLGFDAGRSDGILGPRTATALREFQRNVGLVADGTCGPKTLRALRQLSRTVTGGRPDMMREEMRLLAGGAALAGKVVVIDPGHGDRDRGAQGHGLDEAGVVEDLAARLEGRLGAVGVAAYLTRGSDNGPADEIRAQFANNAGADLLVSLHSDAAPSPGCNGVATFYYRGTRGGSAVGERLADLVRGEIVARTDLLDCGTHPKTWELLRLTRMPAVRVEVGYLTNPGDAARLGAPEFRDTIAEAIVAGIRRLYLPRDLDVSTGQLALPALAS
ncbi:MAG TPA: N-acetylmuramoyl-L-alanine amidase [Mycobacteriales bacterium]|nr:N-acetylmuramoyl-L-alanine amidase [Mycobacteriales bacterium]